MIRSLIRYVGDAISSAVQRPLAVPRGEAVLMMRLLQHPRVQSDLGLNGEQVKRLREAIRQARQNHREEFDALRARGEQEFAREIPTLQGVVALEFSEGITRAAVLGSAQRARLRELVYQNRGPAVFGDPAVQEKLAITADQKTELRSTVEEGVRRTRGRMRETEGETGGGRKDVMNQALTLLTDEQRRAWSEMVGKPLDLGPPSPGDPAGEQ